MFRDVKITDLIVNQNRKRQLDKNKVVSLAESIKAIGLLNPITINNNNELIAGLHRLEACKSLGLTKISANSIGGNYLDYALAEIDENLIRSELTVLERAEHLADRKKIYEEMYPETIARNKEGHVSNFKSSNEIISSEGKPTFSESTSKMLGVSQRSVQQEVSISENLSPELKEQLREMPLSDRKVDLLELSKQKPEVQKEIVEKIQKGEIQKPSQYYEDDYEEEPEVYDDSDKVVYEPEVKTKVKDQDIEDLRNEILTVLSAYTKVSPKCREIIKTLTNFINRQF